MDVRFAGTAGLLLWVAAVFAADIELPLPDPKLPGESPVPVVFAPESLNTQQIADFFWSVFGEQVPVGFDLYTVISSSLYRYDAVQGLLKEVDGFDLAASSLQMMPNSAMTLIVVRSGEGVAPAKDLLIQTLKYYCGRSALTCSRPAGLDGQALQGAMHLDPSAGIMLTAIVANPDRPAERALRDGTYTGTAEGYGGTIEAVVKIEAARIVDIHVSAPNDKRAKNADRLIPRWIRESSSTDGLDSVTGATITADAVTAAVGNALEKSRNAE